MERHREARRGTMAAMNGGLSRRRPRSSGLRDSPEDELGMEMHDSTRLRDRGSKKDRDRDRDRSGRNKRRRRGERMLHGSNRDDGEESSEESLDEDDEDEDDDGAIAVRLPPPPPPLSPAAPLPPPQQNHHHQQHRKSFPVKTVRVPPWKAADEIGVTIPKKARSASAKRSLEYWVSGAGGGGGGNLGAGGGEQIQRQPSTSPSRLSPASAAQISPTSSNVSARKKLKLIGGTKHRPPKMSKPSSGPEAIEMEIAEVLSKLKKQEAPSHRLDSKDGNGSSNEVKPRVSQPNSTSPPPATQLSILPPSSLSTNPPLTAVAPKRKRPRPVKFDEESPTNPGSFQLLPTASVSSAPRMDVEQPIPLEKTSPKSEMAAPAPANENDSGSINFSATKAVSVSYEVHLESAKLEPDSNPVSELMVPVMESDTKDLVDAKVEVGSLIKETPLSDLEESITAKMTPVAEGLRGEKFTIDLMAPPPGRLSPERDDLCDFVSDHRSTAQEIELVSKIDLANKEEEEVIKIVNKNAGEILMEGLKTEKSTIAEDYDSKKHMPKGKTLDLQLDLEKLDNIGSTKHQLPKQQSKAFRAEPQSDKTVPPSSLPMPLTVAGWAGGFPPFGYMGQVPPLQAVVPTMETTNGPSSTLQVQQQNFLSPPVRPKRCATHCYIAKDIQYHQGIARMNPFWPAAAGNAALFGAKPYNLNVLPPSELALLGNPLQGSYPGRNLGSLQDNKGGPIAAAFTGSKEKLPMANTNIMEAAQRKQLVIQQSQPQPGSVSNMLGPAFILPFNQHQAVAAAAAAAIRSGAVKSTPGPSNAAPPAAASSSVVASSGASGPAAAVNFGYAMSPNDAQYLAFLQNNGYPFPIPAHVAGPPAYRGGAPPQAMPFFNGSLYSSQILHPSQLQQKQQQVAASAPQQATNAQQGPENTSTSSGSSSSQKHPQQPLRAPRVGANIASSGSKNFPPTKQRSQLQPHQSQLLESDTVCEDNPSTGECRVSQAQKSLYGHNMAMSIYPQNFALMSTAATAAALGNGGGHSEKQSLQQQKPAAKVELAPSQAIAMSFASMNTGIASSGLDFSTIAQNHALFGLPDAVRHGYQMATAAAAVAEQHKKARRQTMEDGKSAGDSMNASNAAEERKMMGTTGKSPSTGASQHSLAFTKPDSDPPISTNLGNSVVDSSSWALNFIPPPSANGSRISTSTTNAAPTPTTTTVPANIPNFQQSLLQKQAQELHLQHHLGSTRTKSSASSNNASVYSERLPSGSTATKFPRTMNGFPQGLIQGSSTPQSPQWKTSGRAGTPAPTSAADPLAAKTHLLQQQAAQQATVMPNNPTQISFGANPLKSAPAGAQHLTGGVTGGGNSTSSAVAAAATTPVGYTSNPVSKSTGGSPRASSSAKAAMPANRSVLQQHSSTKSSTSSSSRKSSPNRNAPSILGHPQHITPATNSNLSKQMPQLQQYRLQQHPLLQKQPQLFFSNAAYMQAQATQANAAVATAAAAANYYRRQSEQQQLNQSSQQAEQQKQSSNPVSAGMLALCSSGLAVAGSPAVSDTAKATAAPPSSMKGLPPPGLMHAAQVAAAAQSAASCSSHPLMPAVAAFPYMSMPPVSVKPGDQNPATGNDNLHACWQHEKKS